MCVPHVFVSSCDKEMCTKYCLHFKILSGISWWRKQSDSPGDTNSLTLLVTQSDSPGDANSLTLVVMQSVCPGDAVWLSWWCSLSVLVTQSVFPGDKNSDSPGDANSLTLLVTQTVRLSWWCNLTLLVTQTVWLSRWHSQTLPVTRKVRLFWWQSDSPGNTKSLTRLGIEMSDSWWHCLTRLGAQTVWLAWPCWSQTSFYGHLAALSEVVTAISVRWSFVVIIWWSVILCRHHSL